MSTAYRKPSGNIWIDTFHELVEDELDYSDSWSLNFNYSLTNRLSKKDRKQGWRIYCKCAYARFQCSQCSHSWPSARVVVLFHYRLRPNMDRGNVIMRPFGQMCGARKCDNEDYELPEFSEDEVEEVLLRLLSKIKKNCYDEENDDEDADADSDCSENIKTKPHKSSLCEACKDGICCLDDDE